MHNRRRGALSLDAKSASSRWPLAKGNKIGRLPGTQTTQKRKILVLRCDNQTKLLKPEKENGV
jgi:hypothetical protein